MNTLLSSDEQARLTAVLRPGEELLWQGKGTVDTCSRPGFLARLFGKTPPPQSDCLYAVTARRVLMLPPAGEAQEWMLMLGLIQSVDERPDGSGDIVFDYEETNGQKRPRGIIGVPQVASVRNILASAIDAAYIASPWSV